MSRTKFFLLEAVALAVATPAAHLGIWYFDRKDSFRQALIEAAFVAVGTLIAHLAYRLICERGNSSRA